MFGESPGKEHPLNHSGFPIPYKLLQAPRQGGKDKEELCFLLLGQTGFGMVWGVLVFFFK